MTRLSERPRSAPRPSASSRPVSPFRTMWPSKLNRLFVSLADDSGGEDGVPPPMVTVPVLYGPMILPGYLGYFEHTVVSGDTLSALAETLLRRPLEMAADTAGQSAHRARSEPDISGPDPADSAQRLTHRRWIFGCAAYIVAALRSSMSAML